MKYLISFLFVLSLSCGSKKAREEMVNLPIDSSGIRLYEKGFLKFSDSLMLNSLRSDLISEFNIYNERNYKIAHIDAEELAEFNFDFFVPRLNLMLAKRKFILNVELADNYEDSNEVFINNVKIKLYTKEELENGLFWGTASRNFFREINNQLNTKEAGEMFYLLYGGNDLHVILLTEEQLTIIADYYKNDPKEIPILPI